MNEELKNNQELKTKEIIQELKNMIYSAKSPKMDNSHEFDLDKADKLLTQLYLNTRHNELEAKVVDWDIIRQVIINSDLYKRANKDDIDAEDLLENIKFAQSKWLKNAEPHKEAIVNRFGNDKGIK
jgi:hypothetical protein